MFKYIWGISSGLIAGVVMATAMTVTPVQAQQGPSQEVCEQLPQHIRWEYGCAGSSELVKVNSEETVVAAFTNPVARIVEAMKPHKGKHKKHAKKHHNKHKKHAKKHHNKHKKHAKQHDRKSNKDNKQRGGSRWRN